MENKHLSIYISLFACNDSGQSNAISLKVPVPSGVKQRSQTFQQHDTGSLFVLFVLYCSISNFHCLFYFSIQVKVVV